MQVSGRAGKTPFRRRAVAARATAWHHGASGPQGRSGRPNRCRPGSGSRGIVRIFRLGRTRRPPEARPTPDFWNPGSGTGSPPCGEARAVQISASISASSGNRPDVSFENRGAPSTMISKAPIAPGTTSMSLSPTLPVVVSLSLARRARGP